MKIQSYALPELKYSENCLIFIDKFNIFNTHKIHPNENFRHITNKFRPKNFNNLIRSKHGLNPRTRQYHTKSLFIHDDEPQKKRLFHTDVLVTIVLAWSRRSEQGRADDADGVVSVDRLPSSCDVRDPPPTFVEKQNRQVKQRSVKMLKRSRCIVGCRFVGVLSRAVFSWSSWLWFFVFIDSEKYIWRLKSILYDLVKWSVDVCLSSVFK